MRLNPTAALKAETTFPYASAAAPEAPAPREQRPIQQMHRVPLSPQAVPLATGSEVALAMEAT
jgi:hypothetical protein